MAQILLKNDPTPGKIPTHLAQGEIAINTSDGTIFYSDGAANNIKQFGISSSYASNSATSSYSLTASYAIGGTDVFPYTGSALITGSLGLTGSLNITGSTTQIGNNTLLGNTLLSGSITISGSKAPGNLSASVNIYGDTAMSGFLRFNPNSTNIDTSISSSYIYSSGSTNDLYFSQNTQGYANITRLRWLEGNMYSGLLNGGLIATASSTTYTVTSGSGIIISLNSSYLDNPFPTTQYVSWNTLTANIAPLTASFDQSFVAINASGNIEVQGVPYTDGDFNTKIPLGVVVHQNHSTINAVQTFPSVAYGWKQRSNDFIRAFGGLKISGYTLAQSGSSTGSLTLSGGTCWVDGRNYIVDPNNPSYITEAVGISTSKIYRYNQTGSQWNYDTNAGAGYATIDPSKYSNNGIMTPVPTNDWTIQRVFYFPNSGTKAFYIYYGNDHYATQADAAAAVSTEPFAEAPNTAASALYIGYMLLRYNANFTVPASYKIYEAGLFRATGAGGAGGGGTTLPGGSTTQIQYNNAGGFGGVPTLTYNGTGLSATGSFSGSFTGDLIGTSSFAVSSSYALSASWAPTFPYTGSALITGSLGVIGSLTQGSSSLASGIGSHAEGQNTLASGPYSHAEGRNTTASISYSHAEGNSTKALGQYSHAEGNSTVASDSYAHAEGEGTTASGNSSHAEGRNTTALGFYSHAEGLGTVSSGSYQHVQGQYNISSSAQSAFIVGNGTADSARSNLIFASGSQVQITGSLIAPTITGSLFGTSSFAVSSSRAVSSSFATTASYVNVSTLGGFVQGGNSFGATATLGTSDNNSLIFETNNVPRLGISNTGKITSATYNSANSSTRPPIENTFIDLHPESSTFNILPFYANDIAYNTLRGGTFTGTPGPGSTYVTSPSQIEAMFDGAPSYAVLNATQLSGSYTASIVFPQSYQYANTIGFSFGATSWAARDFKVEILVTGSYYLLDTVTNYADANYNKSFGYGGQNVQGARISFSNFASPTSTSGFRIADIYLLNYNGQGGKSIFLGRDGGLVYKSITISGSIYPATTSTYDLGSSGTNYNAVYANSFNSSTGLILNAVNSNSTLFYQAGIEKARIQGTTGNLLLNTSVDDTINKLQVSGSARITNGLTVTGSLIAPIITGSLFGTSSWAVSSSRAVSSSYALTASYALNGGGGGGVTGGATNYIALFSSPTSVTSSILYQTSSNVGIGTTTPQSKLDVNGDALINGLTIGRGGGNTSTNTALGYQALSSSAAGNNIAIGYQVGKNHTGEYSTLIGSNVTPDLANFNIGHALNIGKEGSPHFWAPPTLRVDPASSEKVLEIDSTTYSAAFIDYNLQDGVGAMRAGTLKVIWKIDGTYKLTEEATDSIGYTIKYYFTTSISGGIFNIVLFNDDASTLVRINCTCRLLIRPS